MQKIFNVILNEPQLITSPCVELSLKMTYFDFQA